MEIDLPTVGVKVLKKKYLKRNSHCHAPNSWGRFRGRIGGLEGVRGRNGIPRAGRA
jgi:hypothetical protein